MASVVEVTLPQLIQNLNATQAEIDRISQNVLDDQARQAQQVMSTLAPRKTGNLRRAITIRSPNKMTREVGPFGVAYARYVTEGTGIYGPKGQPYTIRPRKAKALRFKVGNKTVFAKSVTHPGIPPNPFMEDTKDRVVAAFVTQYGQAIANMVVK